MDVRPPHIGRPLLIGDRRIPGSVVSEHNDIHRVQLDDTTGAGQATAGARSRGAHRPDFVLLQFRQRARAAADALGD